MAAVSEAPLPASVAEQPKAAIEAPSKARGVAEDQNANRSKKQIRKRGTKGSAFQQEISVPGQQSQLVRLLRSERRTDMFEDSAVVQLSTTGKATQLQLGKDRLSVTGHKGFRTVRATHGVFKGAWYCEVLIKHLGRTGHARVGWCTKKAEMQAPVGFDVQGFAYRDLEGSKVHNGLREPYGAAFKEGDVVGMLIHLPEGGRPIEPQERNVFRYKGNVWYEEEPEREPQPLPGSSVHFTLNGVPQGPAFVDILEGTYYPAVSLYTLPEQTEGATVQVNFGPEFAFPVPVLEGMPVVEPMSTMAVLANEIIASAKAAAAGTGTAVAGQAAAATAAPAVGVAGGEAAAAAAAAAARGGAAAAADEAAAATPAAAAEATAAAGAGATIGGEAAGAAQAPGAAVPAAGEILPGGAAPGEVSTAAAAAAATGTQPPEPEPPAQAPVPMDI